MLEPSFGYRYLAWLVVTAIQGLSKQSLSRRPSLSSIDELGILGDMIKEEKEVGESSSGGGGHAEDKEKEKESEEGEISPMASVEEAGEESLGYVLPFAVGEGGPVGVDVDHCFRYFIQLPHDVLLPYATFLGHLESAAKQQHQTPHPLLMDCQVRDSACCVV